MSFDHLVEPFDLELKRKDDRIEVLKDQLSQAYERGDYSRAERVDRELRQIKGERKRFGESRDTVVRVFDYIEELSGK